MELTQSCNTITSTTEDFGVEQMPELLLFYGPIFQGLRRRIMNAFSKTIRYPLNNSGTRW